MRSTKDAADAQEIIRTSEVVRSGRNIAMNKCKAQTRRVNALFASRAAADNRERESGMLDRTF